MLLVEALEIPKLAEVMLVHHSLNPQHKHMFLFNIHDLSTIIMQNIY